MGGPRLIESVGAGCEAARPFAGIDHAGIAAMDQFIEVVLRLAVAADIADQVLRQPRILDAILLLAGLAQRAAVEADARGVTDAGIGTVKSGGTRNRDRTHVCP